MGFCDQVNKELEGYSHIVLIHACLCILSLIMAKFVLKVVFLWRSFQCGLDIT